MTTLTLEQLADWIEDALDACKIRDRTHSNGSIAWALAERLLPRLETGTAPAPDALRVQAHRLATDPHALNATQLQAFARRVEAVLARAPRAPAPAGPPRTSVAGFTLVADLRVPEGHFWIGTEAALHKFRPDDRGGFEQYDLVERADELPR